MKTEILCTANIPESIALKPSWIPAKLERNIPFVIVGLAPTIQVIIYNLDAKIAACLL
jgi:hypothetical protein